VLDASIVDQYAYRANFVFNHRDAGRDRNWIGHIERRRMGSQPRFAQRCDDIVDFVIVAPINDNGGSSTPEAAREG
jgi:hypothetical protein